MVSLQVLMLKVLKETPVNVASKASLVSQVKMENLLLMKILLQNS